MLLFHSFSSLLSAYVHDSLFCVVASVFFVSVSCDVVVRGYLLDDLSFGFVYRISLVPSK